MDIKILKKEKSIYKVNLFYLCTIIWSIFSQFLPTPANSYQYIAFLIPISIYLFFNRSEVERILKPDMLDLKSTIIIFLIWLASLPLIFLIVELYIYFFGSTLADIVSQDTHETFAFNLFFTAVTPAILEEILMRGIILDGYRNKSRLVAATMNGLMFGMLHLNSFQFFHTFIAGFLASFLVFATNSIFAGILIHMINNGLPLTLNYLYPPNPNIGYAEDPNFLLLTLYALLGVMFLFQLIKVLFKINNIPFRKDKDLSDEKIFNLPLILSMFIFLGFSALIIFSI
ncbi:CPBP family intramembrane metalloprotease [Tissierella carlieri]|uniref:CPBP family intramembrane metalloprotease n=1 Tax=Tissierella carlieri TaxID=689904 RepID=A0ABT1SAW9_9FIRM|nr:CPBP family intramembrane glutamic endopeptidase [Tissierella carlieri]MBU5312910.1 CPBP family intramembrane metalloprotease [Tissierella carlieri]MCQ4923460.1 CPBP family intramembrane metalloprotease [Tissierella carlieri]